MFLTEESYNETMDLITGGKTPSLLLKDLIVWAKETFQVNVCNYICDTAVTGLRRLQIVLWDNEASRKMFDGPNYDKEKQSKIAKKFAELCSTYQMHKEYEDHNSTFVSFETICDEIQKRVMKKATAEIGQIQHPDIWKIDICFGSVHIFYETDAQISVNAENGISDNLKNQCTQIIRKYDEHNVYSTGAKCVFSSHQTVNEKYAGSMFYYYR